MTARDAIGRALARTGRTLAGWWNADTRDGPMTPRGTWAIFAVAVLTGYAAGQHAWPAAAVFACGLAAGLPLVTERVHRAGQLERHLRKGANR